MVELRSGPLAELIPNSKMALEEFPRERPGKFTELE